MGPAGKLSSDNPRKTQDGEAQDKRKICELSPLDIHQESLVKTTWGGVHLVVWTHPRDLYGGTLETERTRLMDTFS